MLKKIFSLLAVVLLGGFITNGARAELLTFDFTATVTLSQHTELLTGGVIPVPSVLTGSYTFNSIAVDQDANSSRGFYIFDAPPYGFTVQAGSNVFQTDPGNVQLWIVAEDGAPGSVDQYDAQSLYNVWPLAPGTEVDFGSLIRIKMVDTVDFIFGDSLPLLPPQPTLPPKLFMDVDSPNFGFFPGVRVEANIESLTLRPPPTVESTIQDCKNFVAGLPTSSFRNSNMMSTLLNKLDALKGAGEGTKNKLINDILAKGNGCGTAPDSNDWIKDCAAQAQFQAAVQAILDLL